MTLLASDRRDVVTVVVFAVGVGILTLAMPATVQALVNFVAFGGLVTPLLILGLLLFAFMILAGAIRAYQFYIVELLQRRLFVRVVTDLSHRLPRVHVVSFDRNHGPELVNRFFDVLTVQKVGATLLLDTISIVLQAAIGLMILGFYHPFLLAFDLILVGGIALVLFPLGRGALRTAIAESKAKYAVAASLEELARNPMTFKQSGGPAFALKRADDLAVTYVKQRQAHYRVVFRQILGSLALQAIAATALLTIGGQLVMQGELTLGQLVAAELIVSIVLASFAKIGQKLESFYDLLAAVDKLGQLIDLPLERTTGLDRQLPEGGAAVIIRDLSFSYDGKRLALSNFNFSASPGERVCIVGGNGSGKSTLAELFSGSRTPTGGHIELDGADLRELNLDTVRREVAVLRGFEIIEGTIEENVRMNRSWISGEQMREVLGSIGLLDEIRNLPDGMGTRLSTTGAPLSYGQGRRLMLARAIVGRPRLLVVDDLLDDLDAEARQRTIEALFSRDYPWTLILLTHGDTQFDGVRRVVHLGGFGTGPENGEPAAPSRLIPTSPFAA